jgi:hypothetical protein
MSVLIGEFAAWSTWGKCRGVIYNTTTGQGLQTTHSITATADSFKTVDGTFFRVAEWPKFEVVGSEIVIYGPFAFTGGVPGTGFGYFDVAGYNFAAAGLTWAPHNLDDKEIQATWVGRNVTLNSGTLAMAYTALDGTASGGQSAPDTSTTITSFDL